ncbi:AbrB/MazE/SpoVT family DNA-binding domain-containing protein [Pelagibaculum spongiae]|uniref:MazF family transcriptional regulator n=1 Tax=Pelagibaculum spongiae TaxID=2080658 RepID=A0A2V1GPB0_9GAMM|nr:AbrB/MazE/SpoVT family DNA-binding domain-containing protein [Pelagibaculum spongiae]PVZ64467.1 MazF family transcriptional regulator [Pelagibaculum spongiae]
MKSEIKRWGNSAAVRLPSKLLAAVHLEINSPITIEIIGQQIIIKANPDKTPRKKLPFSEQELLQGMDPRKAHADELSVASATELGI